MIIKLRIAIVFMLMLCSVQLNAQTKTKKKSDSFSDHTVDNVAYVAVIDNATLPVGAIKTKSVLAAEKNTTGQMKSHNEKADLYEKAGVSTNTCINQKVSPKFAVSKTDVKKDGDSGSERMNWTEALVACVKYKEGDEKVNIWRVPTQRELMLMYQMKAELNAIGARLRAVTPAAAVGTSTSATAACATATSSSATTCVVLGIYNAYGIFDYLTRERKRTLCLFQRSVRHRLWRSIILAL